MTTTWKSSLGRGSWVLGLPVVPHGMSGTRGGGRPEIVEHGVPVVRVGPGGQRDLPWCGRHPTVPGLSVRNRSPVFHARDGVGRARCIGLRRVAGVVEGRSSRPRLGLQDAASSASLIRQPSRNPVAPLGSTPRAGTEHASHAPGLRQDGYQVPFVASRRSSVTWPDRPGGPAAMRRSSLADVRYGRGASAILDTCSDSGTAGPTRWRRADVGSADL